MHVTNIELIDKDELDFRVLVGDGKNQWVVGVTLGEGGGDIEEGPEADDDMQIEILCVAQEAAETEAENLGLL